MSVRTGAEPIAADARGVRRNHQARSRPTAVTRREARQVRHCGELATHNRELSMANPPRGCPGDTVRGAVSDVQDSGPADAGILAQTPLVAAYLTGNGGTG